jgi:alkylation response protein AidB-like acyl-CoA dehydrogenase
MQLALTQSQESFRDEVRGWLAENAPGDPAAEDTQESFARRRRWQRRLAAAGYVGVDWPEEHGGRRLGPVERALLDEELADAGAPTIAGIIGVANIGPAIIEFGTPAQKARYLEPLRTGDEIWCQGMSEPGAGSDLASLGTRAVRDGEEFVVNGQKIWCSNADEAEWCQLYVRTGPEGSKHAGISCLLVEMRTPGIEVRPIRTITGSAEFCEVYFTDARVPASQLLGEVDAGWSVAITTLMNERMGSLFLRYPIRKMLAAAIDLARVGNADAATRQAIGSAIASAHAYEALCLRLLEGLQGGGPGPEGSLLKVFGAELQQSLAELGLELSGADAAASDALGAEWQRRFLDSRSITIAAGTSEILRNVIGERILGLPKG